MAFLQADLDLTLEFRQSGGLLRRRQLLQVWRPVRIDAELGVGWEAGIDGGGQRCELRFQGGREVLTPFGDAEGGAVAWQPSLALGPGQELGAVVGEGFGADDEQVTGLQGIGQVDEHAHLQRAPVEDAWPGLALRAWPGPALGDER